MNLSPNGTLEYLMKRINDMLDKIFITLENLETQY